MPENYPNRGLLVVYGVRCTPRGLPFRPIDCHLGSCEQPSRRSRHSARDSTGTPRIAPRPHRATPYRGLRAERHENGTKWQYFKGFLCHVLAHLERLRFRLNARLIMSLCCGPATLDWAILVVTKRALYATGWRRGFLGQSDRKFPRHWRPRPFRISDFGFRIVQNHLARVKMLKMPKVPKMRWAGARALLASSVHP